MLKCIALLFFHFALAFSLKATAPSESSIKYTYLGGDSFRLEVFDVASCSHIHAFPHNCKRIVMYNTCHDTSIAYAAISFNDVFNPYFGDTSWKVYNTCPSYKNSTSCHGGSYESFFLEYYSGVFHFPTSTCSEDVWTIEAFGFSLGRVDENVNRNRPAVNNTFLSVDRKLEEENELCYIDILETPKIQLGRVGQFAPRVVNPDNDSLVFSFVPGRSSFKATSVSYIPPYTGQKPLGPKSSIDPATGLIRFVPDSSGYYTYTVNVCEYQRGTGMLKACNAFLERVYVNSFLGNFPDTLSPITSFSGSAQLSAPRTIDMCPGDSFKFSTFFRDVDQNDSLRIYHKIDSLLPGAVVQVRNSHPPFDTIFMDVSWKAPIGFKGQVPLIVSVLDNHCPFYGKTDIAFMVRVGNAVFTGADQQICRGEWARITPYGAKNFHWQVLSGEPIDTVPTSPTFNARKAVHGIGESFEVSPNVTTTYVVQGNLGYSCKLTDTITVVVARDFTVNAGVNDTICYGATTVLSASLSTGTTSGYAFEWQPASSLVSNDTQHVQTQPIYDLTEFVLKVTSDSNCVNYDTVSIEAAGLPFPNDIAIAPNASSFCRGDTVSFKANLSGLNTLDCVPTPFPCQGSTQTIDVFNTTHIADSISLYSIQNLFRTRQSRVRNQYLYRKGDLNQYGIKAGAIRSVSFYVDTVSNAGDTLHNLEVRLGCTSKSILDSSVFEGDILYQVLTAKDYIVRQGWNTFVFDQSFQWSGSSNLVVDVVRRNLTSSLGNHKLHLYGTNYNASLGGLAPYPPSSSCGQRGEGSTPAGSPGQLLPVVRFEVCSEVSTKGYRFQWNGSSGIQLLSGLNDSIVNGAVQQLGQHLLTLTVEDTSGICRDTIIRSIQGVNQYPTRPLSDNPRIVCEHIGGFQLQAPTIPPKAGVYYKWSGSGVMDSTGAFDADVAGLGVHTLTYEVLGDRCASIDTFNIKVVSPLSANFTVPPLCVSDNSANFQPQYSGGVWHGDGILDSNIAALTMNGLSNPPANNQSIQINVTHTLDSLGCQEVSSQMVTVFGEFIPRLDTNMPWHPRFHCYDDSTFQLKLIQGQGHWRGNGIMDTTGLFNGLHAGVGTHQVVVDSNGFCGGADTFQLNVPHPKQHNIINPGPFCDPQFSGYVTVQSQFDGGWSAPLSSGGSWMPFTTIAKFKPSDVVANHGYGTFQLRQALLDTILKRGALHNICTVLDSIDIVFAEDITVQLIDDIYACGNAIDTTVSVSPAPNILWSTGDTTATIRITKPGTYWVEVTSGQGSCVNSDTLKVYSNCLSVDEGAIESLQFSLFPNPAQNEVKLISGTLVPSSITVTSAEGKRMWQGEISSAEPIILDISQWKSGMYWVHARYDAKQIVKKLVVIK